MSEAVPMDLVIADLQISGISDKELEDAFHRVVVAHTGAVKDIQESMRIADEAYRKYLNPDYIPEEDIAKVDRATLNKAEKTIAEKYADLKEAYERPLHNFEANIRSIRNAIKEASGNVDKAVKTYEEKRKSKKREEIERYFATKNFELIALDRIFDNKWLNKGTKMKDVQSEIDNAIAVIYRDIEVLEKIPEHGIAAKAFYLQTLDMGAALRQVEILKENAERLMREQAGRDDRKLNEQVERNAKEEHKERREEKKAEEFEEKKNAFYESLGFGVAEKTDVKNTDIIQFTCTFKGTKEQLMKLREYMTASGISYEKGFVLESEDHAKRMARAKNVDERIYYFIYAPTSEAIPA